jgi:MFS family permease
MQNIAMYWLVLSLTHSALAVAVLSIARFGPFTLFALFAGVIADRLDNRKTVILTQSTQMVLAAALTVLAFTGLIEAWHVDVIAFLGGTVLVLDAPARQGLTFQMVGRDELPNAVALNSTLFNTGRVAGPALAGAVIGALGIGWCFAANTVSFLAVLTSLLLMRTAEMFPLERKGRPTIWRGTREGLGFARRSPRIVAILLTTTVFASLLFNFNILLPVLAKQTLHQGPAVFGVIMSAFGAGALVGALGVAAVGRASWRVAAFGATAFATCELLLAPLRSVWLVAALLFVIGIFFTIYTSNANSTVQLETPDHLRGREDHLRRLRQDHRLPVVEPVGDHAGEEREERERAEAGDREHRDRERRVGQREHQPVHGDVLHPGAADRDDLAREEEPVVAVAAQARERALVQREQERAHRSRLSGPSAASIASSSDGSSSLSRPASHDVRRARTRLSRRAPSSVSVNPTRLRSAPSRTRSISPAFSSRST